MSHDDGVWTVLDRRKRIAAGLAALGLGVAAVVGVSALPMLDERWAVVGVSLTLALVGVAVVARRAFTSGTAATTADVEYRGDVTVPGAGFDAVLDRAIGGFGTDRFRARREIGDRLGRVAVAVVARAERIPTETARERVRDGTWTDDPEAADFLAGDSTNSSAVDRALTALGRRSRMERSVDRVVEELWELAPGLAAPDDLSDSPPGGSDAEVEDADGAAEDADAGGTDVDAATGGNAGAAPDVVDTTGGTRVERDRRTGRWRGATGLVLIAVGVGAFAGVGESSPSLVVAAAAVAGAVGYGTLSTPPSLAVAVERTLDPPDPAPGDRVTVTLELTNAGDSLLADLRAVDGVPSGLRVVDGSPRLATALRPGETARISYAVEATRGDHEFDPVQLVGRDVSGAVERERHVGPDEPTVLACGLELGGDADVPVHPKTARQVGRVVTDAGGQGLEFHSVREYRRGDPLARVDWNRLASTGEFATVQFREEHAATVVVLVDARREAYVAPRADAQSALEWQLAAADVVVSSLLAAGDSVGLAALSPEWCWLEPRGGTTQRARARRLLETHAAFDGHRPTGGFHGGIEERRLRRELPADAQLVLLAPLCDEDAVAIARGLHVRGYPVTVVSPDVTAGASTGRRLAALERAARISRLRAAGVRVVDWDTADPLVPTLDGARRRWST